MAQQQPLDLNKLLQRFPFYQDQNRIRTDVVNVWRHVRTLTPQAGTLILNTGRECQLLVLSGTVAIFFRGAQYNIPVEIFLTENYPASPPMVYVRPTANMALKNGHRHVDSAGLVYLPYLHEWNARTHNLVELCAHMSSIFGQDPPVFSKPTGAATISPPPQRADGQQQARPAEARPVSPARPVDPKAKALQDVTGQLQSELQQMFERMRSDIDNEFDLQSVLEATSDGLAEDAATLRSQQESLRELVEDAKLKNEQLKEFLESEAAQGEVDPSDLVKPQDALSRQALNLVAETLATEDAMYYLDQAILDCRITVDDFLREVRKLARRQYACRALLNKVREEQQRRGAMRSGSWRFGSGSGSAMIGANVSGGAAAQNSTNNHSVSYSRGGGIVSEGPYGAPPPQMQGYGQYGAPPPGYGR